MSHHFKAVWAFINRYRLFLVQYLLSFYDQIFLPKINTASNNEAILSH